LAAVKRRRQKAAREEREKRVQDDHTPACMKKRS